MSEPLFSLQDPRDVISLPPSSSPRSISTASSWTIFDPQALSPHPLAADFARATHSSPPTPLPSSPGEHACSDWSVLTVDSVDFDACYVLRERPLHTQRYGLWPSGATGLSYFRREPQKSPMTPFLWARRPAGSFLWAPRELLQSESEPVTDFGSSGASAESDGAASCGSPSGNSADAADDPEQRGALLDPLLRMGFLRSLVLQALGDGHAAPRSDCARRRRSKSGGFKAAGAVEERRDAWGAVGHWFAANAGSFVTSTLQGIIVFVI